VTRRRGAAGRGGALVALALVLLPACATRPPRAGAPPAPGARGYRALFRGEAEGPRGKDRFRLAVALVPPDRLRLEFFGPVGGARAVLLTDGATVLVALPDERAYDLQPASAAGFDRLLGLPLEPAGVTALLTGRPICPPEAREERVMTRPAAAFGRSVAWFEIACPPNDIRYRAVAGERGGILREASIRQSIGGAMILGIEYDDHEEGLGPRWPRRLRLSLPREGATLTLVAAEGPAQGDVPETLFVPVAPSGFERRALRLSLSAPGLAGSVADGGP
jgi:hypothetical protein